MLQRLPPLDDNGLRQLTSRLGAILNGNMDVAAAWLHGSVVQRRAAHDIDVAVLPAREDAVWAVVDRVALELQACCPQPVPYDVRPLLTKIAPALRFRVVRDGRLLVENDRSQRILFEADSVRDYLDIRPFLERGQQLFLEALAHDR